MTFIKICGITNLADALAAVEAGADALGFNFYRPSPRYIAPHDVWQIIAQLPETILTVGVFVNEESEVLRMIAADAGVAALQLHGDESPAYCQTLRERFVIKALPVGSDFDLQKMPSYEVEAVMLDAKDHKLRGGTGRVIDWWLAKEVRKLVPKLFLAGGLSVENIQEAIAAVEPYGVDACSGLEDVPGRKNHRRMRSFVSLARVKP